MMLPAERWAAARRRLAPAGATVIRLCRYSSVLARPPLTLVNARLLTAPTMVRDLVNEFDRLPSARGVLSCVLDQGSQIDALLAYPAGERVTITVKLTGCETVTNGSVLRSAAGTAAIGSPPTFGPQLLIGLERLIGVRPRTGAGNASVLEHGHWSVLARSPLGARDGAAAVWDGHELLELGGTAGGRLGGAPSDSAAAYNPTKRRWRRLASAPATVLPANAASVWTGHQVFIFGGPTLPGETSGKVAGLYDPVTDRWTRPESRSDRAPRRSGRSTRPPRYGPAIA